MKKNGKRFREEQIIYALREVQGGRKIAEVCRELGVTEQTYHRWKRKYAGMGVTELRRLKQLEDEWSGSDMAGPQVRPQGRAQREQNASLRKLVADLSLDKHILQEIVGLPPKKWRRDAQRFSGSSLGSVFGFGSGFEGPLPG